MDMSVEKVKVGQVPSFMGGISISQIEGTDVSSLTEEDLTLLQVEITGRLRDSRKRMDESINRIKNR
ncbi:MAG: hypothetical protein V3R86_06680 [Candidatus Hydrothermarchaeaceae archaeon]